jgi:hypothetical protein
MTLSTQLDIAALTDAWTDHNWADGTIPEILAPYVEVSYDYTPPRRVIHATIYLLIQDELDRRDHEAQQARFDMKARALGYRDWPAVLRVITRKLDEGLSREAADLYWAVVK